MLATAASLASATPVGGDGSPPEPMTAAAVHAADEAWDAAEVRGDAGYIDWLLVPEYQSVGSDGKSTRKAR